MIDINYKSQWDNDATGTINDCGPTCIAMILNYYGEKTTTDEIFKKTGASVNTLINFQQLYNAISFYGYTYELIRNSNPQKIKELIDKGIPPIALIHYGDLSSRQDPYKGAHFIVLSGYKDDGYFAEDPDFYANRRNEGHQHFYIKNEFENAWKNCSLDGNPVNSLLVIYPMATNMISEFLTSKGYVWPEAHLDVVKALYESDQKLKSGNYILKTDSDKKKAELTKFLADSFNEKLETEKQILEENFNLEKKKLEAQKSIDIKLAVDNAVMINNQTWQDQLQDCVKMKDTNEYKFALWIYKLLHKGGEK